jgi:alginate O-acetyltransferase complex protein AlgI
LWQARIEARLPDSALLRVLGAAWPVAGFLLCFALIASREAVPFLYFQF